MAETPTQRGNLVVDLSALLASGDSADVILLVGGLQLPAHRAVLTARSSVFAAMLRHDMQEVRSGCIEIPDMEEDVLRQLLSYMYTDETPLLQTVAPKLLVAAEKYDVPLLKKRCEEQLVHDLCIEDAATSAVLAIQHSCPRLRKCAIDFIRTHAVHVMGTDGWVDIMQKHTPIAAEICRLVAATTSNNRTACEQLGRGNTTHRLHEAATRGSTEDVRDLLASGAVIDVQNGAGWTPLHCAAALGHDDVVAYLLRARAPVNATDYWQETALHKAAWLRHVSVVRLLAAASADLDARGLNGSTPLHYAAELGHADVVRTLLHLGADKSIKDNKGKTPLEVARQCKRVEIIHTLM